MKSSIRLGYTRQPAFSTGNASMERTHARIWRGWGSEHASEESVTRIVDGLLGFVYSVVVPLETAHADMLEYWRLATDERGAHSRQVQDLMAPVREASAEAGHY